MPFFPALPNSRSVGHAFKILFAERNPACGRGLSDHGVHDLSVIDEYSDFLQTAYDALTGAALRWPPLTGLPVMVRVYALDGAYGFADLGPPSSMVLHSGGAEPRTADARARRAATAVHELTHLMQFSRGATLTWRWLNEASATALETHVHPANRDAFQYLEPWICAPHRSLDVGEGYYSFPFVSYLMKIYDPTVVAAAYLRAGAGAGVQAIDALAAEVASRQLRGGSSVAFASASNPDVFGSRYCRDAYFLSGDRGFLGGEIRARFGYRAVSESFCKYPVRHAAKDDPVDHLGCRYYRFRPTERRTRLQVTVALETAPARQFLRVEMYAVRQSLRRGRAAAVTRDQNDDSVVLSLDEFHNDRMDHAVLIISNCAFGSGAPDNLTFRVSAHVA